MAKMFSGAKLLAHNKRHLVLKESSQYWVIATSANGVIDSLSPWLLENKDQREEGGGKKII